MYTLQHLFTGVNFAILNILTNIFFPVSSSQPSSSSIPSCSVVSGPGDVSKVHVDVFCGKHKFAIHRKEMGIPKSFRDNVRAAMKKTAEYNLSEYNCIHFALELLNVDLKVIHLFLASQKITMSHKVMIMSHDMY